MTDRDFDLLLEESVSALPPTDELVEDITPFRKAMNRVIVGLGLVTITVNLFCLDTLLPAIGMVMMLLGFRALCRENRWFTLGYGLSFLRTVHFLIWLFLDATIYSRQAAASPAAEIPQYAMVIANFLQILALCRGIRAVRRKTGSDAYAGGTTALLVLNVMMTILGFWNYSGILGWVILIVYVLTLRTLWDLSKALDEAGYTVSAAPVIVSDRTVKLGYTAVIFLSLAVGYLFLNQYPMDWTPAEAQDQIEVRAELEALGFPGYVLDDLTEKDLLACRGAKALRVEVDEEPINDGRYVEITVGELGETYTQLIYDVSELRVTHVAVELGDEDNTWLVFHHFLWQADPGYRGTEAIQIYPAFRKEDCVPGSLLSGRVLCDWGGASYTAPYYSLEPLSGTTQDLFFGSVTSTDFIGVFSFPGDAENCRGYVCYSMNTVPEYGYIDSWCGYYYQESPLCYPVRTADTVVNPGIFSRTEPFKMIVTSIQSVFLRDEDGNITHSWEIQ